jgi:hypothetical protein
MSPMSRSDGGNNINKLIESLEERYSLGLKPRDKNWTPTRKSNSLEERCVGSIKLLYFKARENLDRAINEFKDSVTESDSPKEKLAHFMSKLNPEVERTKRTLHLQSPASGFHTPEIVSHQGSNIGPSHNSSSLTSRLRNLTGEFIHCCS